jgi:hypothetical protein
MIESIHQSSLGMGLRCGEQFRRRYGLGHIIPPSIAAARGTGVHEASKVNLRQKIITGRDMPLSDILDAARDGYVHAFEKANGQVYLPKEDWPAKKRLMAEGQEDAIRCAKLYLEKVAPGLRPKAVEEPFRLDVGLDLPLAGIMDYQEEPRVGDLKTASRSWRDGRINEEIQPVFYSFVHEAERGIRPDFVYHILVARRGKDGRVTSEGLQEQSIVPTDAHYHGLFAKLRTFIRMIQAGVFPPANPGSWWCAEKWCGYWATCPYVGNAKQTNWI